MRLSADQEDPSYAAYKRVSKAVRVDVYLNGKRIDDGLALTADTKRGVVVMASLDEQGNYTVHKNRVRHHQVVGRVEFEFMRRAK